MLIQVEKPCDIEGSSSRRDIAYHAYEIGRPNIAQHVRCSNIWF